MIVSSMCWIVLGILMLGLGAYFFITSAVKLATYFNMPKVFVGVVLLGLATSFPEIMVSCVSAMKGSAGLSIGNAVGSNTTNLGLILPIIIFFVPVEIKKQLKRFDFPVYCLVLLAVGLILYIGYLTRFEGVLLLLATVLYIIFLWVVENKGKEDKHIHTHHVLEQVKKTPVFFVITTMALWFLGLVVVIWGSDILVKSSVDLARIWGLNEVVIGLTIVAIGTALPELAASLVSIYQDEHELALGNIIGSCIFNLLAVLAMPALLSPSKIPSHLFYRDYTFMFLMSGTALMFAYLSRNNRLNRLAGTVLFVMYVAYLVYLLH